VLESNEIERPFASTARFQRQRPLKRTGETNIVYAVHDDNRSWTLVLGLSTRYAAKIQTLQDPKIRVARLGD